MLICNNFFYLCQSNENFNLHINRCLEEGAQMFMLKPLKPSDVKKLTGHLINWKIASFNRRQLVNFIRLICLNMPVIEFCFTKKLSLITTTHVVIVWLRNSIVWMNDPVLCNTTTISFSFPIYSCKITAYRLVLVRKKSTNPPHKQFQKGKFFGCFETHTQS